MKDEVTAVQRHPHPSSFCLHPSELVQGVGFEPTYGFRRPGLQPGAINHSTTPADVKTRPSRWRDLNPRPAVYKTAALPLSYTGSYRQSSAVSGKTRILPTALLKRKSRRTFGD